MWTCRDCGLEILFGAVEPEADAEGFYFMCPGCDARNELVNIGGTGDGDPVKLIQPDT